MGCFDLFHPGHLALFKEAKQRCDRLVVAVADDVTVTRMKGENRPVLGETLRMQMVEAVKYVDKVVRFSLESQRQVVLEISPNRCFAGPDGNARLQGYLDELELGGMHVQKLDTEVVHSSAIEAAIVNGQRLVAV